MTGRSESVADVVTVLISNVRSLPSGGIGAGQMHGRIAHAGWSLARLASRIGRQDLHPLVAAGETKEPQIDRPLRTSCAAMLSANCGTVRRRQYANPY